MLICVLLFVEETGVPVPLLSGDVLLVLAGALMVNGRISPWAFFPPAFVAEVAGVMVAHLWSRTVGQRGLELLADKVRGRKALDRATARLSTAGPLHITVARLIPGLRITTSVVAGAAGVAPITFLLGVVPAIVIWLVAYTFLGMVVGVPVLALLNQVQHLVIVGIELVVIVLVTAIGIRFIPSAQLLGGTLIRRAGPQPLAISVVVDTSIAAVVAFGTTEVVHAWLGLNDAILIAAMVAGMVLLYVGTTRRVIGGTAGEYLTGARYTAS